MTRQSMNTLRSRRAELGLVQMNLWIREEDRVAFEAAVAPFKARVAEIDPPRQRGRRSIDAIKERIERLEQDGHLESRKVTRHRPSAKEVPPLPVRLAFPSVPPAALRDAMKGDGWAYDRSTNVWSTQEPELVESWLAELVEDWGAQIIRTASD
ncbi:hypothetical protein [Acidiphilium sp. JA12-A1]|uniref:hypothetical protein n=1 Tax=Acidiphilium sp. JA12-A1 TaxID=1464546 RepID=UPI000461AF88|nr:hypothetical protein [Acidiphilium sp. JA12-A1]KDM65093.1 hypothetical protein ACIDI_241c00020 [Acidiphilium sp. JA12-A1]KDM65106.1 hypothetical protein ACIDI_241c00150 [Acidiphilium sp. JA12-A1]